MGLPRYINQRDQFSCGVVAVMNALKWSGKSCSMRGDRDRLSQVSGTLPDFGTSQIGIDQLLRREGQGYFTVRYRRKQPTLKEFYRYLKDPKHAVVMSYDNGINMHTIFIPNVVGKNFQLINDTVKVTLTPYELFKNWHYREDQMGGFPVIWYLRKENSY